MACKSPINLRSDSRARLKQGRVIDGLKNSEVETVARTATGIEDSRVDEDHSQFAAARACEADGQHDTLRLEKPSGLTCRAGFEEVSYAVPASILLALAWNELVSRVSAALLHSTAAADNRMARFGDVQIDLYEMAVSRSGKPVALTTQEFKALRFLVLNPRRVISRDELLSQAWGYQNYPSTRTVDNHILKLRQKLETDPSSPTHFQTVHGTGYKFVP
ncbi:MAG TPA: response regulator transcription factor [Candidatus Sulfotelmatobacter sp.]